jgi:CRP-like cAMP-binding protein
VENYEMNHINIEEKIKHLNRCSTFKDLGVKVIRKIAENSEEIEESSGKHLYFQGEDADHFYLVISGKVEIKGAEIIANAGQVFTCGASSLVGYSSHLLAQESPRQNKSARVVEDSKLLKINERAIKIIKEGKPLVYREHCATTLRELLSSAPQTEVIKQLRLEPKVFSNAEISVLVAGERVFEEGDISDFAYFIIGGSIKIVRKNSGIQEDMVARLRPGQMFGERGFEEENSRAAGAESEGVSTILCINHKALRNISKTNETMHRLLANQSDLYTMKDSSGIIPKAIKNLNIASKVTILALAAMVAITGSWYFIGTRVLNDNFSHRLVAENKHNLEVIVQKIKNSYDEYIEQERFFLDFANSSKKNGDMISIGSHRELDIYLFNGISRPTMSVNKIIEDAILLDIENIFDGNTVSQGFQHIVDENISAYYKVTPSIIDGKVVAVVASVFDPIKISGRENLMISIPGKSTILGKFRGRERDLDRQPNDFLQVGPLIYSVAKEKIELPDISFGSYTWVDLSTALAQEKSLKIKILVSIIMSITVSVSLIYFLTAWAMHPFKDLSHSIRRLTEGQRSIIIPYADRTNEFGRLAKDFATLQDAIARSEGAVAQRLVDQQKKLQRQEEAKVNIQRFQNIFDEYVGDFHDSVETFTKISGLLLESSTSASNSTD